MAASRRLPPSNTDEWCKVWNSTTHSKCRCRPSRPGRC
jgi:hypothetical protein